MKFIYFCVLFGILAFNLGEANVVEKLESLVQICFKDFPITPDELTKATNGDQDPDSAPENVKCFIGCLAEKEGIISKGVFDFEKFAKSLEHFPDIKNDEIPKAIGKCKSTKGKTDCDRVFKILMCTANELHTTVFDM